MSEIDQATRRRLHLKTKAVQMLFATPQGKEVIKLLQAEFDRTDLRGENTHETYYKLGQRDVIMYLNQLNEVKLGDD